MDNPNPLPPLPEKSPRERRQEAEAHRGEIVISQTTVYYFVIAVLFFVAGFAVAWVTFSARADDIKNVAVSAARDAVKAAIADASNGVGNTAAAAPTTVPKQDIKFSTNSPAWGPANARVTVVEYSDFQCPFCEMFYQNTYPLIRKNYGDKVRFVYQQYPLTTIHPDAMRAANAAECAREQNKFWEYHDALFSNQKDLSHDALVTYATQVQVPDIKQFTACLDAEKYKQSINDQENAGSNYSVSGTPTFFINGNILVGAQDYKTFSAMIDKELSSAN